MKIKTNQDLDHEVTVNQKNTITILTKIKTLIKDIITIDIIPFK